jgi:hypothetical protein
MLIVLSHHMAERTDGALQLVHLCPELHHILPYRCLATVGGCILRRLAPREQSVFNYDLEEQDEHNNGGTEGGQ